MTICHVQLSRRRRRYERFKYFSFHITLLAILRHKFFCSFSLTTARISGITWSYISNGNRTHHVRLTGRQIMLVEHRWRAAPYVSSRQADAAVSGLPASKASYSASALARAETLADAPRRRWPSHAAHRNCRRFADLSQNRGRFHQCRSRNRTHRGTPANVFAFSLCSQSARDGRMPIATPLLPQPGERSTAVTCARSERR